MYTNYEYIRTYVPLFDLNGFIIRDSINLIICMQARSIIIFYNYQMLKRGRYICHLRKESCISVDNFIESQTRCTDTEVLQITIYLFTGLIFQIFLFQIV